MSLLKYNTLWHDGACLIYPKDDKELIEEIIAYVMLTDK